MLLFYASVFLNSAGELAYPIEAAIKEPNDLWFYEHFYSPYSIKEVLFLDFLILMTVLLLISYIAWIMTVRTCSVCRILL
jgi:hypothetical protein